MLKAAEMGREGSKNKEKMPGAISIMTYSRVDHKQGLFAVNLKKSCTKLVNICKLAK